MKNNKETFIVYSGDKYTDVYTLVKDDEVMESISFSTHNKGNLVGVWDGSLFGPHELTLDGCEIVGE